MITKENANDLKKAEEIINNCMLRTEVRSIVMPFLVDIKIRISGLIRSAEQ